MVVKRFQVSVFSTAAGLKSGQFNRERNLVNVVSFEGFTKK
jgi:hypothetical protein